MKIHRLATITVLSASTPAFAADGPALFQQHHCGTCHTPAGKSAGPSLADIAARYRGDKSAQARLEAKVRNGGNGSFGIMPMPATPKTVSDADIQSVVAWILSRK